MYRLSALAMTWIDEFRRGSLDFPENSVHVVIFRLPRKIQLGCLLTHVETTLILFTLHQQWCP
jgi:hypothetical protein